MLSAETIWRRLRFLVLFACTLGLPQPGSSQTANARIAGTVVDAATGRPITAASIEVMGTTGRAISDVEGRYRTNPIPAGIYRLRVTMFGYAETLVDSVRVNAGEVATVRVVLQPQALQLEAVVATATSVRAATAAGLLATQRNAPGVMDGISAEQINRSTDSNAAGAIARVTGVSVVDNKFVVVRGLTERYSSTLLNGVELASPEPTRRVVPLDIFPATLLESIVAVKTATPDLPGDFAGGSVNIQTKDFPEQRVLEVKVTQSANSETTFSTVPVLPRNGFRDRLGFDGANRFNRPPADFNYNQTQSSAINIAKSIRNAWDGKPTRVAPDLGVSAQYANQIGDFDRSLGYVFSFDYGFSTSYEPADYFALMSQVGTPVIETRTEHTTTTADWGLLANVSLRLGPSHTLGVKNLVTQESEEFLVAGQVAYNSDPEGSFGPLIRRYQVRYVERAFRQTQLKGQHRFSWPFSTTWNWTLTASNAARDEPENRSLTYMDAAGTYRLATTRPNFFWMTFLDDQNRSANADVSIPINLGMGGAETLVKAGVSLRRKERTFDGYRFSIAPTFQPPPDGTGVWTLPPEQVVAPENLGRNLRVLPELAGGLPYNATDQVNAGYLMADLRLPFQLRLVGGVRVEDWSLFMHNLFAPPGRDSIETRRVRDILPSVNLTRSLGERMNLRAAFYRTVARPDPREIALGDAVPVTGKCTNRGQPDLNPAQVLNGDLRWEMYPEPGELLSLSAFYKLFKDAIVEYVAIGEATCIILPVNARTAYSAGAELEARKGLGVIHPWLEPWSAGLNLTYAYGHADLVLRNFKKVLDLQDLSNYVANANLTFNDPDAGMSASLLFNYFSDRVTLYGDIDGAGNKNPDIIEAGKPTLDFKISKRFGPIAGSFSARNIMNRDNVETQATDIGIQVVGRSRPGRTFSLSVGYAF